MIWEAVAFLTPFGGARRPTSRALWWFPMVGAAIGLVLGVWWWAAERLWPPAVAAVLVVLADLALTGLLHADGLADAADGLLPPMHRDLRLAVMAEPDIGAFGAAALMAVLLARFAALASTEPRITLLVGVWTLSRAAMAVVTITVPYARNGGLATAFRKGGRIAQAGAVGGIGLVGGVLIAIAGDQWAGLWGVVGATVAFVCVIAFAFRRIGGFTGDVLGAAGMVAETAGLLVGAAKW